MAFKFNPFTGTLDLVGSGGSSPSADNFSYNVVASLTTVTIPTNQQMVVVGPISIDGVLNVDGNLALIGG